MIRLRVELSDHPDLALVGAAAARRGDTLLIVISTEVPADVRAAAVRELVSEREWGDLVLAG